MSGDVTHSPASWTWHQHIARRVVSYRKTCDCTVMACLSLLWVLTAGMKHSSRTASVHDGEKHSLSWQIEVKRHSHVCNWTPRVLAMLGCAKGTFLYSLLHWPSRTAAHWNHAKHTPLCVRACVDTNVCLSTGRRWSVTAWSLGPWRVMERDQASCSIWPHGRTQNEKENTEEKRCHTTCAVCLYQPSITAYRALTRPYFSYHEATYTHKTARLLMAFLALGRIMRWLLISQVSRTDMNNTGYFITHLPHCRRRCQLFRFTYSRRCQCHIPLLTLNGLRARLCDKRKLRWIKEISYCWSQEKPLMGLCIRHEQPHHADYSIFMTLLSFRLLRQQLGTCSNSLTANSFS